MTDRPEHFGQVLRRVRTNLGLSLREVSNLAMMSKSKIHDMETRDGRNVAAEDAAQLDEVLGSGAALTAAAQQDRVAASQQATGTSFAARHYADLAAHLLQTGDELEGVAVRRRTFLQGASLSFVVPSLALEATRHGLDAAMADRMDSSVEEWQEIVRDHGYCYQTTAPHELLQPLMVDMIAIQYAVPDDADDVASYELRGVAALLAALTAMTLANLGQLQGSRRWWRTARKLADRSNDARIQTWVRGREVVRALYEQRPIGAVLRMVDDCETRLPSPPRDALPELIAGKAQALALAGRPEDAAACLNRLETLFDNLPAHLTKDGESIFGWAEDRLRFTQSFVYSFVGNYAKAEEAQRAAVKIYPATYVRGPAQIELQRALCLAKKGDSRAAVRHATTIMTQLPSSDHVRPIRDLGARVLTSLAGRDLHYPEVEVYRELLDHSQSIGA